MTPTGQTPSSRAFHTPYGHLTMTVLMRADGGFALLHTIFHESGLYQGFAEYESIEHMCQALAGMHPVDANDVAFTLINNGRQDAKAPPIEMAPDHHARQHAFLAPSPAFVQ